MQLFNVYLWFARLVCTENKSYTIYVLKIHRAELTQAELTQGRVDSGADLTSGRVDPLPMTQADLTDQADLTKRLVDQIRG